MTDNRIYVIYALLDHAVDITERVHLESLLRDSEERYRTVTEGLEEGVLFKPCPFMEVNDRRRRGTLHGLLTICYQCKRIRDAEDTWWPVDVYVRDHSEAKFSHGLCAECVTRVRQQYHLPE